MTCRAFRGVPRLRTYGGRGAFRLPRHRPPRKTHERRTLHVDNRALGRSSGRTRTDLGRSFHRARCGQQHRDAQRQRLRRHHRSPLRHHAGPHLHREFHDEDHRGGTARHGQRRRDRQEPRWHQQRRHLHLRRAPDPDLRVTRPGPGLRRHDGRPHRHRPVLGHRGHVRRHARHHVHRRHPHPDHRRHTRRLRPGSDHRHNPRRHHGAGLLLLPHRPHPHLRHPRPGSRFRRHRHHPEGRRPDGRHRGPLRRHPGHHLHGRLPDTDHGRHPHRYRNGPGDGHHARWHQQPRCLQLRAHATTVRPLSDPGTR
ncbi:hypothetical protein SGPA1_12792 [Streptomyces misionensis JCM 4497]